MISLRLIYNILTDIINLFIQILTCNQLIFNLFNVSANSNSKHIILIEFFIIILIVIESNHRNIQLFIILKIMSFIAFIIKFDLLYNQIQYNDMLL